MKEKEKNAKVLVSIGLLMNDGNFDNLNFNFAIELPCYDNDKDVKKAQKRALDMIKEQAKEITGAKDIFKYTKLIGKMSMKRIRKATADLDD